MPRGAYTSKQDRKAEHIEEGYEKRGVSRKEAERRAWATVNKQDKGGKNAGSGRSSLAFENLDRALDGAKLAMRQAFKLIAERRASGDARA